MEGSTHTVSRYLPSARRTLNLPLVGGVLVVLLSCGACQSSQSGFAPDDSPITVHVTNLSADPVQIRYVYGRANPVTLGNVGVGGEEVFRFRYSNNGDLRLTGEFLNRRSGTSNPIINLRPAEVLELTVLQSYEMRLERRPAP
jgi:hypothetical protein